MMSTTYSGFQGGTTGVQQNTRIWTGNSTYSMHRAANCSDDSFATTYETAITRMESGMFCSEDRTGAVVTYNRQEAQCHTEESGEAAGVYWKVYGCTDSACLNCEYQATFRSGFMVFAPQVTALESECFGTQSLNVEEGSTIAGLNAGVFTPDFYSKASGDYASEMAFIVENSCIQHAVWTGNSTYSVHTAADCSDIPSSTTSETAVTLIEPGVFCSVDRTGDIVTYNRQEAQCYAGEAAGAYWELYGCKDAACQQCEYQATFRSGFMAYMPQVTALESECFGSEFLNVAEGHAFGVDVGALEPNFYSKASGDFASELAFLVENSCIKDALVTPDSELVEISDCVGVQLLPTSVLAAIFVLLMSETLFRGSAMSG